MGNEEESESAFGRSVREQRLAALSQEFGEDAFACTLTVEARTAVDPQRAREKLAKWVEGSGGFARVEVPDSECLRIELGCPAWSADLRSLELVLEDALAPMQTPSATYDAYAAWRAELQADSAHERSYWTEFELPANTMVRLPLASPRTIGAFAPRALAIDVPTELVARLREAEAEKPGTRRAILLATWAVLVGRACAREEVAVATRLDGRTVPEVAGTIGCLEEHLPIVIGWRSEDPFTRVIDAVQSRLAEAAERQEYYDSALLSADATFSAWLPFSFDYRESMWRPGVSVRIESESSCIEPFELRLTCRVEGERLDAQLGFDSTVLDERNARSLASAWLVLLTNACREPQRCVAALELTSEGSTAGWFSHPIESRADARSIDQWILERAAAAPESLAVRAGTETVTYAEVERRSRRLASALVELGVRPGQVVGLLLDRGAETHAAILGIWRAGAAYLPLDVDFPSTRIEFMLRDSRAVAVVTQASHSSRMSQGLPLLCVDATERAHPIRELPVGSGDLAYVLYTSGTTGAPNGVKVGHRSLLNYLLWAIEEYEVCAGESSLVHSPLGFDLTLTALLAPLLVGGTVVMMPQAAPVEALAEALWSNDHGLVKLTPSHLDVLNRLPWRDGGTGRTKVLVVGGEELKSDLLPTIRRRLSGVRIVNEYGPTEATVGCSAFTVPNGWTGRIPIGVPIANTRLYVLDNERRPVPAGIPGELYVGGDCLALGYLERPQLENDRFIPDPFAHDHAGRLYRTGDRVVERADGLLVYLGRTDAQLKLRGVRVEPGEIETVLRRHHYVAEAIVVDEGSPDDGKRLAAFIIPADDAVNQLSAGELIAFLREHLPAPLIPSHFYLLDHIPLTKNGKLDRRALFASRRKPLGKGIPCAPPIGLLEQSLAAIWTKVLETKTPVGREDNYFALGGDSIRSIRVTGEARARGLELSVADVHRFPTVRLLAEAVESVMTRSAPLPPTSPFSLITEEDRRRLPTDVEDAYPLNLLQEGMIYHRSFSPKSAVYHAMISLELRAKFDLGAMHLVIRKLVGRHPLLRTSFELTRFTRPLQLVHRMADQPLMFRDLSGLPQERHKEVVSEWMEDEKKRGFEVDEYPLIRFMLHKLTNETFRLTFSYHHEIIDGWSEATMLTQVLAHYLSLVEACENEPQVPKATFRDAIALEIAAVEDPAFHEFWNNRMAGATLMRLPRLLSGPKPDKGEREIVKLWVPFALDLAEGARRLADTLAVPLKSVLLAAHLRVMAMFGGQSDVVTHMVAQGRPEDSDGADVIGLFVNSFTVRQRLPGGSFRDLVLDTHRNELETMPYRRYPMAELKRHQGREPLSETLFFFIDYHVYDELKKWHGAELLDLSIYGESTFPFCATFRVPPLASGLQMQLEYDSLLFSARLMNSIIESYKRTLTAMIADVDAHYFATDLLAEDEKPTPLRVSHETDRTGHGVSTLHEWFEATSRASADAVAVVQGDQHVTYGYLDALADGIAADIRASAKSWAPVAIVMRRSPDLMAAIFGVLKSGRAYVPVDASQAAERSRFILSEGDISAVLTDEPPVAQLEPLNVPILTLFNAREPRASLQYPKGSISPASIAYVIYTSGSTGQPKGVAVTHANLTHSTMARLAHYPNEKQWFLLLSSHAFDSAVAGIFGTLCSGGTLVLPEEHASRSIAELWATIERQRVTHLLCIPSLYATLLDNAERTSAKSLRGVIVAGEACPRELWEQHQRALHDVPFYNEYGPTECTVWATVWEGNAEEGRSQLPIGCAIANTSTYILGPGLTPAPIGVHGELCIGGRGVALGYVGDPALTAARFLPDGLATGRGARMYRSGDIARNRADGQIEFLGRSDNQVKVRGFRVELQEIESILDTHVSIHRSVVHAHGDTNGEKELIAYVVPKEGSTLTAEDVKRHASANMPKYMCPALVELLPQLPLTQAGKVDRRALPEPTRTMRVASDSQPGTYTEKVLVGIWSRILGRDNVGIHDEFFELGGESLRAMRVAAKVCKAFNVNLSAQALLEPDVTIARLGKHIDELRWALETSNSFGMATGPEFGEGVL
jgi:nonribosomal peptide synthetase protein BlmX